MNRYSQSTLTAKTDRASLFGSYEVLGDLFPSHVPHGVDPRAERGAMNAGLHLVRRQRDHTVFVLKVIKCPRNSGDKKRLLRERAALLQCAGGDAHPNIIDTECAMELPCSPDSCIISTFCDMGNLESVKRRAVTERGVRLPESFVWHVFKGIAKALAYLHYGLNEYKSAIVETDRPFQYFIHRDIKPANIFLRSNPDPSKPYPIAVLGDFGLAMGQKEIEDIPANYRHLNNSGGTLDYYPPEMQDARRLYGRRSDVWQLAAVVTELLGISRFGVDLTGRRQMILKPDLEPARVSGELEACIYAARIVDIDERIDSQSLMRHVCLGYKKVKFRGLFKLPIAPLHAWHFTDSLPHRETATQGGNTSYAYAAGPAPRARDRSRAPRDRVRVDSRGRAAALVRPRAESKHGKKHDKRHQSTDRKRGDARERRRPA